MVGIVLVSHSHAVATGVEEMTRLMAPDALTASAGGLEDGGFGTSFELVKAAVEKVWSPEGVLLIVDTGSSVMTAEMVIESLGRDNIQIADAPFLEGALNATVNAELGKSLSEIKAEIEGYESKF